MFKIEAVIKDLEKGNERFSKGKTKNCISDLKKIKELTKGQKPKAIVVTCSDSRVSPEILFDQGLGDLFVIRVAGNVLDSDSIASIEYALDHLGVKLLVIMGHEDCGAVKSAMNMPEGESTGSKYLDSLLTKIQNNIKIAMGSLEFEDKNYMQAAIANIQTVIDDLVENSDIVNNLIVAEEIEILPAMYSLETGKVGFFR